MYIAKRISSNDAQRLYSLIDYIGGDYQFAVNSGKIINEEEYNEMTEFSDSSLTIFSRLNSDDSKLKLDLETLDSKIKIRHL